MSRLSPDEAGVTLVELVISLVIFAIIALSMSGLFVTLVRSAIVAKRRAVASSLATNQMEYLKSLPYDNLAVSGGSIIASSYLPATATSTLNGVKYTTHTSISYVDDAYDGCGSYPSQALKQQYCRNFPPPTGAPATDTNPADYKVISVYVGDTTTNSLATVSTQVAARVSETASTTGALFVSVLDDGGNPVSGASVNVVDTTLAPNVNVNDSTDGNGVAIFYGLPPDTNGFDYVITAAKTGYSTLGTIAPAGVLTPTYSSQKIVTQSSSYVTLTIKQMGSPSLLVETTDTTGSALANVKFYIKGGYKKYTATTDTTYYYDNTTQTTDASGFLGINNLVPGDYYFCGDAGATSCAIGGTTYYLAAAVPYGGTDPLEPVQIPTYDPTSPPATTYPYGAGSYLQKVRLMLSTQSTFPRVTTLTPGEASIAAGLSSFGFVITGANLPCSATAGSCSTTVKFLQGSNTYTASCTGTAAGLKLTCTVNLSGASLGITQLQVITGGKTLTLPGSPLLGGINVTP